MKKPFMIKTIKSLAVKLKLSSQNQKIIKNLLNILIILKEVMEKLKLRTYLKLLDQMNKKSTMKKLETTCFCGTDQDYQTL